jgi:cyclase
MTLKKIIPCLDTLEGRVVKGINFAGMRELGDPAEFAEEYCRQGADELVLLDISATVEGRETMLDVVRKTAEKVSVPFTVGGGISSVGQIKKIFEAGAQKVSINSAAVKNPALIKEASEVFGKDRITIAIDGKKLPDGSFTVLINGGNSDAGIGVVEWAKKCEELGAGEILLTSKDADGVKCGYDIEMTKAVCNAVNIPVVASGGAGTLSHFVEVFEKTGVSAALAASLFHFKELTVGEIKEELKKRGISVK